MNPCSTIPGITRLAESFDGLLLDAYGVFWGGNAFGLLPGTKEAMEQLVSSGKVVGILSNSTQLGVKEISKLQSHGVIQGIHFHFLLTSGDVVRSLCLSADLPEKFFLFGEKHPKLSSHEAIFQDTVYEETPHLQEADFIYIAVPHIHGEDQTDPKVFIKEVEKLAIKEEDGSVTLLPMLCPNPDLFAHEGNPPRAVVRQGSIAKIYEKMGGEVHYIGKPSPLPYAMAMGHFKSHHISDPAKILMVGDTPETDIRGARGFHMPSALLTQTGIMAERVKEQGLAAALEALPPSDTPDYLIERFIDDIHTAP